MEDGLRKRKQVTQFEKIFWKNPVFLVYPSKKVRDLFLVWWLKFKPNWVEAEFWWSKFKPDWVETELRVSTPFGLNSKGD